MRFVEAEPDIGPGERQGRHADGLTTTADKPMASGERSAASNSVPPNT